MMRDEQRVGEIPESVRDTLRRRGFACCSMRGSMLLFRACRPIYGFDDLKVGLMYLPLSGGSLVAALVQGRIIDWFWFWFREGRGVGKRRQQDLSHFPIEIARLQVAVLMLVLACLLTVLNGWVLHFRVNLAGPCIVLFFLGYTLIASTQTISILIVDTNPGIAGTGTAAFNLIRCLLGAGPTALILPMTERLGLGCRFVPVLY